MLDRCWSYDEVFVFFLNIQLVWCWLVLQPFDVCDGTVLYVEESTVFKLLYIFTLCIWYHALNIYFKTVFILMYVVSLKHFLKYLLISPFWSLIVYYVRFCAWFLYGSYVGMISFPTYHGKYFLSYLSQLYSSWVISSKYCVLVWYATALRVGVCYRQLCLFYCILYMLCVCSTVHWQVSGV